MPNFDSRQSGRAGQRPPVNRPRARPQRPSASLSDVSGALISRNRDTALHFQRPSSGDEPPRGRASPLAQQLPNHRFLRRRHLILASPLFDGTSLCGPKPQFEFPIVQDRLIHGDCRSPPLAQFIEVPVMIVSHCGPYRQSDDDSQR